MSFGFSLSDLAIAISILDDVYDRYKKSHRDYREFSREVDQVRENLEWAQEICQDTHWSTVQQKRIEGVTSDLAALVEDLSTFLKTYESLENGSGRTRDRLRYPLRKVEKFREHIMRSNVALSVSLNLIR